MRRFPCLLSARIVYAMGARAFARPDGSGTKGILAHVRRVAQICAPVARGMMAPPLPISWLSGARGSTRQREPDARRSPSPCAFLSKCGRRPGGVHSAMVGGSAGGCRSVRQMDSGAQAPLSSARPAAVSAPGTCSSPAARCLDAVPPRCPRNTPTTRAPPGPKQTTLFPRASLRRRSRANVFEPPGGGSRYRRVPGQT